MKYLKSFFGTLILFLLVLLITTPVIAVTLLIGEIIALPITMLVVGKLVVSNKIDWVLGLILAVFDE